jgi:hypothetical protein
MNLPNFSDYKDAQAFFKKVETIKTVTDTESECRSAIEITCIDGSEYCTEFQYGPSTTDELIRLEELVLGNIEIGRTVFIEGRHITRISEAMVETVVEGKTHKRPLMIIQGLRS